MNIRHTDHATVVFALAMALPACSADHQGSAPQLSMSEAIGALASAVASCQSEREACRAADAGVTEDCQAVFQACRSAAVGNAMPDLERGVGGCAQESRSCRQAAQSVDERKLCGDQLKVCVAESRPDNGPGDGGTAGAAPVASCIAALRSCIEGDQGAKLCTDELRACLLEVLPPEPTPDADAGEPIADAGISEDSGAVDPDASGEEPAADAEVEEPSEDEGEATECKEAIDACVATGQSRKDCMRELSCRGKP